MLVRFQKLYYVNLVYFYRLRMFIPRRREIPNTRTPKELVAGDTERTNAAYLRYMSIRAPARRTRKLSAYGYIPSR
jgi:hypothetical protein